MKKIRKILVLSLMILFMTGCDWFVVKNEHEVYLEGKHYAEMKIKKYGVIEMELDASVAPITVTNFMKLVDEGYYDGLTIHRVFKDFVIQGGEGQARDTIKGEFDANGVSNDITHERGTISMARAGDYSSGFDTGSTQFFIVQKTNTSLDHYYAAFGHVTKGMEVVDKIVNTVKNVDSNGMVLRDEDMPIIEYIKKVEK